MDYSNPAGSWYQSQFDPTQPIQPITNAHLDDPSLSTLITHYRPNPPVNHQQIHPAHQPPASASDLTSATYSHYSAGAFSHQGGVGEWTEYGQAIAGGGAELGGMYSDHLSQTGMEHSPVIDLYNTDTLATWRPKLGHGSSAAPDPTQPSEPHPSSYTAFSAFLHSASPNGPTNQLGQTQAGLGSHSPAVSPLHQLVPLAHHSPPPLVNHLNRSQSYLGSPSAPTRSIPHPNPTQPLTSSFSHVGSPTRPGIQYHTEPSRRGHAPLSARSMPSDWQAAYAGSLNEHRVRAQSTSHVPLLTGTPAEWNTTPALTQTHSDTFSCLGLTLGDERARAGEVGPSSSSEGGTSDRAPGLVQAERWQHQTELNSSGMVAGRFDNEHPHPLPSDLAGPSSSLYPSPALAPQLESLALGQTYSTQPGPPAQLSAAPSAMSTSFSAYDPQAPASEGKKMRVPRRKPNEPPRNPNMRRYPCPLCIATPRTFARPSALKIHMLTHTKEKPHTCSICLRAFAIPSNLKRHLKLHAKEGRVSQDSTAAAAAAEEGDEGEDEGAPDQEPDSAGHE